ncbi:hypothetical protein NQ315_012811 [Exocentrus adspersus]|uniref:Uncharacterized protein n=1 Tax=Exocentrus adspersus TaxID=1586481 RepID=A0AAV8V743_9CUCU|nr:hypothetical protein NQ315_012811 [Exocentrus adspersus]
MLLGIQMMLLVLIPGYANWDILLKKEDLMLIFMNESQTNMLPKFGNDFICVDGTHGLNEWWFLI